MNRVIQLTKQIQELESEINHLKKELITIQKNCEHEYYEHEYMKECRKCHFIESLCW